MNDWNEVRNRLIADIETVFGDVERGLGQTIHEADLKGHGSADDVRKARLLDNERTWQEVPDEVIDACFQALTFLDTAGFRYYLPAFLRFALRHLDDSQHKHSPAVDWAIYNLWCPIWSPEELNAKFAVFNDEQKQVICRFLRFMIEGTNGHADERAAKEAFNRYWCNFCPHD